MKPEPTRKEETATEVEKFTSAMSKAINENVVSAYWAQIDAGRTDLAQLAMDEADKRKISLNRTQ